MELELRVIHVAVKSRIAAIEAELENLKALEGALKELRNKV
jgi:hypothetical protein